MATYMSSWNGCACSTSGNAIDGNANGNYAYGSVTHTNWQADPYWQVNVGDSWGGPVAVKWVTIWNRNDCWYVCCGFGKWVLLSVLLELADTTAFIAVLVGIDCMGVGFNSLM